MFLFIDNYDSFTYNLVHYFGETGVEIAVARNDQITVTEVLAKRPTGIVISPGPGDPTEAGVSLDLIRAAADHRIPLFGVCLGHQAIAHAFGGHIVRARQIMHGKMGTITHSGASVFRNLPSPFEATRYHSLVIEPSTLPDELMVTASIAEDGTIMGVQHRELPIHGVQFHPESIRSEHGHKMIENFMAIVAAGAHV